MIGLICGDKPIKTFKMMFLNKDEDYVLFNFGMAVILFTVMFLASAATYNTFIDKNNPNYYKNTKIK